MPPKQSAHSFAQFVGSTPKLLVLILCMLIARGPIHEFLSLVVRADNIAQSLPFSQNWTNIGLITLSDDWSGVPGVVGFRGDGLTGGTGVDPQTVVAESIVVDVNANQTAPNTFTTGGVSEFEITNPVVALQGSGTARAPYIQLHVNTTGLNTINVAYNLRDIDGSTDNSVQPVALQFRVGTAGSFTNVPAGFVADASTGPSLATLVTPVSATLPVAAENQSIVQIRIITTDAVGSDEWIGIDDISVTGMGGGSTNPSGVGNASPNSVMQGGATLLTVTVTPGTNPASTGLGVTGDLSSIGGSMTQQFFDDATNGDMTLGDNIFSFQTNVGIATPPGAKNLPITITDAQMRTGNTSIALTVLPPVATRIHDIQGSSHISVQLAMVVSNIPGIVTAVRSNGFYIQDPTPDSDDATSEGIFVFTSSAPPAAAVVGNSVTVSGTVAEFRPSSADLTITEIQTPTVALQSSGNPLPPPIVIGTGGRIPPMSVIDDDAAGDVETSGTFDPATDGIDFYESLEGMRVQLNNPVAVGPTTDFGDTPVLGDDGANASVRTARGGIVIRSNDFNPERIYIDDLFASTPTVNVGDHFSGPAIGILDYGFSNYRIHITTALTGVSGGLTQEVTTTQTTNEIAIATFNVENLDPSDGAPKFNTLASLIVNNLKSPDIICVEEVQDNTGATNDGTVDATTTYNTLIAAIVTAGGPTYQFRQINPVNNQDGGEPGGNIRQGFMYRTDRGVSFIDRPGGGSTTATTVVNNMGSAELSFSPGRVDPTNAAFNSSRKPLAGEFVFNGNKLFIIGNHFNSKGGDDPLFGHRQPPVRSSETARNQQAQIVNNFVDAILAVDTGANIVVLGDINDFEFSTVGNTLKGGVLTALVESLPQSERYSYNFEGNAQTLDHIMVSNNLNAAPFVYDIVHVNSEFVVQSSDHDPSVVRFTLGPTAAKLDSFEASGYDGEVLLRWQTGEEVDNLGFNIYREANGERARLNPQMLAGSALVAGAGTKLSAGRSYSWWDDRGFQHKNAQYWLEEININGESTWHGPVTIESENGKKRSVTRERQAIMLSMLGRDQIQESPTRPVELKTESVQLAGAQIQTGANPASQKAVKITIKREGLYRVTQPELVSAGLDPKVDARFLQLFVDGREQPILVTGKAEHGGSEFGPSDAIEFYGTGLDTSSTNSRVYWLIAGSAPGLRIQQLKSGSPPAESSSFAYTVERKDRTLYFSGLRNGDKENFFGPVVTVSPIDQTLTLRNVDAKAAGPAMLEVVLQGVTPAQHTVKIFLNGAVVGEADFNGQSSYSAKLPVSRALLREGVNVVRLAAQRGEADVSLLDYIRATYNHTFTADDDALQFRAAGKQELTVSGFRGSSIRVFDVTNPEAVQEVVGVVRAQKNGFEVSLTVPGSDFRTLIALTNDKVQPPSSVAANVPSNWRQSNQAADLVIITHRSLFESAKELQAYRESRGLRVALVDAEDIFDEFSFGNRSAYAIREFLAFAKSNWKLAPRFVLLMGDATFDPKDYLGRGDFDLVPTKLFDARNMETASDDWFADFTSSGVAEMAIGRLPVRGADEAARIVAKIMNYEARPASGGVILASDSNEGFDFERTNNQLRALVPPDVPVERIDRGQIGTAAAKKALLDGIKRGQRIVNYFGHGSVDVWRNSLLTSAEARGLNNGDRLPLFVMMTCLNGYFQDTGLDSLAESLMKAEQGGAIAVWASSGMTLPGGQSQMNQQLYGLIFESSNSNGGSLGELIMRAKSRVTDSDVRRTWILFGDPTTQLK